MIITISQENFGCKPSPSQIPKIQYVRQNIDVESIADYIQNGYVLSGNFTEDNKKTISQQNRKYSTFISTPMVAFDLDGDVTMPLDELVDSLNYKPTIAYTTYSHQQENKGNRYRMLYFFQNQIEDIDEYKVLYDSLCSTFDFDLSDNCGRNPTQAIFGTNSEGTVFNSNILYNIQDILSISNGHPKSIKEERENNIQLGSPIQDKGYINDFYNLPYQEIIDKYRDKYPFFEHTPLPIVDDDTPYILLPNDYIEIKRYWILDKFIDEHGNEHKSSRARLIKDGEHRKKSLFLNGILRRKMIPTITFEHLLNCLVSELYTYIDNRLDVIKKSQLIQIAKSAFDANIKLFDNFGKSKHPKFIVNSNYCRKYNLSKAIVRNMSRRLLTFNRIAELYDENLTDKENVEQFKQFDLKVSTKTLQRYRTEFGIKKHKRNGHSKSIIKEEGSNIQLESPIEIKVDNSGYYQYQCDLILNELEEFIEDGFYDIHDRDSMRAMGKYFIMRVKREVNSNYTNEELISMLKNRFCEKLSA